jgi:hypothetical protein
MSLLDMKCSSVQKDSQFIRNVLHLHCLPEDGGSGSILHSVISQNTTILFILAYLYACVLTLIVPKLNSVKWYDVIFQVELKKTVVD